MKQNGIGGANTKTGLIFEGKTDLKTFLNQQKNYFVDDNNEVFYNGESVAFIFKKYGIQHYLKTEILEAIKNKYEIKNHKYIALIEGKDYSDILNHNNNNMDESRGTNCFSLEHFINSIFGNGNI